MKRKAMRKRQVQRLRTIVTKLGALAEDCGDMFIRGHLSGHHAELDLILHEMESKEVATEEPPQAVEEVT